MAAVVRSGGAMKFDPAWPQPAAPKKGTDEVVVEVRAAAINPVDYKVGRMMGPVVGLDLAGVVKAVAEDSTGPWKVGDEVYGTSKGSLAELVLARGSALGQKPPRLSFREAAALPVAYITGLQALQWGGVTEGSRVLVIGASGGCGIAALQLSKAMKAASVVAICSGKNADLCKSHGATEVLDYTAPSFRGMYQDASETERFDVIYDAATGSGAGEEYKDWSLARLRAEGKYVAINGSAWYWARKFTIGYPKNQNLILTDVSTQALADLAAIVALDTAVHPLISSTFGLSQEEVDKAFDGLRGRRTRGKIVFAMDN
eukprot:TRINITY_DN8080_c0_g1_i1.p1 TRINITY_DN8080_c0_g1~~TRINITY_DN8080_c0_g1_i1.p1  ORF type:complete len:340 (+),score=92.06 TRINITY_DN8080_c0_g1_i1:73-1020(+)